MRAHLKYLSYVLRHKWFVFQAGLATDAPLWRLLIHDWSKFLPSEWFPYVRHFYGPVADTPEFVALMKKRSQGLLTRRRNHRDGRWGDAWWTEQEGGRGWAG